MEVFTPVEGGGVSLPLAIASALGVGRGLDDLDERELLLDLEELDFEDDVTGVSRPLAIASTFGDGLGLEELDLEDFLSFVIAIPSGLM